MTSTECVPAGTPNSMRPLPDAGPASTDLPSMRTVHPGNQANAIRTRESASAAVQPPVSRQTTRQVRGLRLPFRFDARGCTPTGVQLPGHNTST